MDGGKWERGQGEKRERSEYRHTAMHIASWKAQRSGCRLPLRTWEEVTLPFLLCQACHPERLWLSPMFPVLSTSVAYCQKREASPVRDGVPKWTVKGCALLHLWVGRPRPSSKTQGEMSRAGSRRERQGGGSLPQPSQPLSLVLSCNPAWRAARPAGPP